MSLLDAFDLVIGIDTEYVSGENLDGVPYDENAVLSYQAFYFHPATGKSNGGYYMTNGPGRRNRHALTSLISRTINGALRDGVDIHGDWKASVAKAQAEKPRRKRLKPRNLRIAIAAHFTRADLATFSDFKSLKKSFDHVRGTFASVKRPTIREIRMPNGAQGEGHADPVRYKASRPRRRRQAQGPRQSDRPAETGRARCRQRERRDRSRHREDGPRLRTPPGRVRRLRHQGRRSLGHLSAPRRRVRRELGPDEDASDRRQHRHDRG